MNILVPLSWLQDFVKTEASPELIAEKLSLHGFSVEKAIKTSDGDTVFEIEITPNRPDAFSVLGIARELGAILPQAGIEAEINTTTVETHRNASLQKGRGKQLPLDVQIQNPELCPRFTALLLKNIKVGESPLKIKERLIKVGLRPLNNVIDITNYLMIERGQPMHVFDYDKLAARQLDHVKSPSGDHVASSQPANSKKMILRESRTGEKITTLDGQERKLPEGTIIIEDGEKIIDLCGIMGGNNSCVDETTTRVVLFVQIYDPMRVRKTTQKLSFRTEASARFEKGMDPRGVVPALQEAATFLIKEAGGKIASKLFDIENLPYEPHQVTVTVEQIENLLGISIDPEKIAQILKPLGFETRWTTASNNIVTVPEAKVTVPSWRVEDIQIPEDLIEEIARIYGYHKLSTNLPPTPKKLGSEEEIFSWERKARTALKGFGFNETYTYSFTNKNILEKAKFNPEQALKLKNPLTEELTHLRMGLLPQLLEIVGKNQSRHPEQKLFQLSRIFISVVETHRNTSLPQEPHRLTGLIYSTTKEPENLFYKVKGVIETLLLELGIKEASFRPTASRQLLAESLWHPERSAKISHQSVEIGILGLIEPKVLANFEISGQVAAFDLDFDTIANLATKKKTYQPILEYPPIIEDLTFEVGEGIPAGEIKGKIQRLSAVSCQLSAKIRDVYRDKKLERERRKAVTFKVSYQAENKSLSDKEIKPVREEIIKEIEKEFGARLRGE